VLTSVILIWFAVAILVSLAIGRVLAHSQRHLVSTPDSLTDGVVKRQWGTILPSLDAGQTAVAAAGIGRMSVGRRRRHAVPTWVPARRERSHPMVDASLRSL
jgi:hypothetical protein